MMKERDVMLKDFDSKISFNQEILYQLFGYENGKTKLEKYFQDIKLYDRKEVYEITDLDLYYQFILSGKGLSLNLEPLYKKKKQLYEYMQKYLNKNTQDGYTEIGYKTVHKGVVYYFYHGGISSPNFSRGWQGFINAETLERYLSLP